MDVHVAGEKASHFLGAIVVVNEQIRGAHIPTYTLIDGQQRLLTISILLTALTTLSDDEELREEIGDYLTNRRGRQELRYKVLPTEHYGDRVAWCALVENGGVTDAGKTRLRDAHRFFVNKLRQSTGQGNPTYRDIFWSLLTRLHAVFINLKYEERPHQIFESLNARGKGLEQADLVRNYLAMVLPRSEIDDAYQKRWIPIQEMFEERRSAGISDYLLNYLACKSGEFYLEGHTYKQFRKRMDQQHKEHGSLNLELRDLHCHAVWFNRFLLPQEEPDTELRLRLERFNALERTVVRPLLLHLYHAHNCNNWTRKELLDALDLLDNYLTRHFLASLSTGGQRRFLTSLVKVNSLQDIRQRLHNRDYPSDAHIESVLMVSDLYSSSANRRRLVYILQRINERLQDSDVILDGNPTVEHIMPRKPNRDWERHRVQGWKSDENEFDSLLHSLGNLTLVSQRWNSKMSNRSWDKKRPLLVKQGLPINQFYFADGKPGDVRFWNDETILARSRWFAKQVLKLWPNLSDRGSSVRHDPNRHPNPVFDYTGSKAASLTIHNKTWQIPRRSWNNLIALFTNQVAISRSDFEEIAAQLPDELANHRRNDWDQELENGWWLCYMGANDATWYLRELAATCDLTDNDWHITLNQ